MTFYRQKGCDKCSFTGYKGRVGVYEVLRMNSQLRKMVARAPAPRPSPSRPSRMA